MTPERWQISLPRSSLLGTDTSREVESLLAAHEQGDESLLERLATADGDPLKVGDRIGHYEILVRIGAGGMGIVYRSRDSRLERDVAVKILSVGLLTNENARRRFRREALALAKLNHANIASVHDVGKQDGSISAKFCSIRHYCFVRGVLGKGADRVGGDDDFRRAFRTLNRLT